MKIVRKKKSNVIPITKKKRKKRLKGWGLLVLLAVTVIAVLLTPLFHTKHLVVEGNQKITENQIVQAMAFSYDVNIFKIRLHDCEKRIAALPYVDTVTVRRKLPSTVVVSITECTPAAYLPVAGGYVILDKKGKLLETSSEEVTSLPVLTGIEPENGEIGTSLAASDAEKTKAFSEIYAILEKNDLLSRVSGIDVSDPKQVAFVFDHNKTVQLGEGGDTEYKLMMLHAAIEQLSEAEAGTIDLSVEGKARFSPKSADEEEISEEEAPSESTEEAQNEENQ